MLLSATRIHNGQHWLTEGTVVEVADNGIITDIHTSAPEGADIRHYEGLICPGFINAHCHLELSHMQGVIPEHTGLVPFLQQVMSVRNAFSEEEKRRARWTAFEQMKVNGIVAVGDIVNTTDTLDLRASRSMHFHSFAEAIGFNPAPGKQFSYAAECYGQLAAQKADSHILRQSVTPHAPYSVSEELFAMIDAFDTDSLLSIHNQECADENLFYERKQGAIRELLSTVGIDDSFYQPSGKTSLQTYIEWLSSRHTLILVHNTFSCGEDVEAVQGKFRKAYWCLCPNANLYIENRLPDIAMLCAHTDDICIGTDSLASNHQLSVLAELETIKNYHPGISWEQLLRWGTYNGARALNMSDRIGSIERGMQPGLLWIQDQDTKPKATVLY